MSEDARPKFLVAFVAWVLYFCTGGKVDGKGSASNAGIGWHANAPTALIEHGGSLDAAQRALANALVAEGQAHVFATWDGDASTNAIFGQLAKLDANYADGGIVGYVRKARALLDGARRGTNPLEGKEPVVPRGHDFDFGSAAFIESEELGEKAALAAGGGGVAYVLVAGGLGERLGYSGIELELPTELVTGASFLQRYIEHILALGNASELTLMLSEDTLPGTKALLAANNNFGLPEAQLHIVVQEKVGCLSDNDARLALKLDKVTGKPTSPVSLQLKPHGHGDVHTLLHANGHVERWAKKGVKWVVLFQDTNALMFKSLPAVLGASVRHELAMNSVCVPRKAGEAIGAIMALRDAGAEASAAITTNVEYNQIDPLLKSVDPAANGDVNRPETGFSAFPGSINQIVLRVDAYAKQLRRTKGAVPEFVNPKYKDTTPPRTVFQKPTRLESMMQDVAVEFGADGESVSFTRISAKGIGQRAIFSPVKNSVKKAAAKSATGLPPHSAASGEHDLFRAHADALRQAGARLPGEDVEQTFQGIKFQAGAKVVLSPSFAPTLHALKAKLPYAARVSVTQRSTLVVEGANVKLESLELDGVLIIDASAPDAYVKVRFKKPVKNAGWDFVPLADDAAERSRLRAAGVEDVDRGLEQLKMRGYRLETNENKERTSRAEVIWKVGKGHFVLDEHGLRTEDEQAGMAAAAKSAAN